MLWQTSRFTIDLSRPQVMGIVNVTPDSFSDGGSHRDAAAAIAHCEALVREGADILDIGGESSRPGAPSLTAEQEWQRVEAVLRSALTMGVPVSLDSCKTDLMRRALDLGVDIVNDIHALRAEGALDVLASHSAAGVCLMHMRGDASTMQRLTNYADVVAEVASFLAERAQSLLDKGIHAQRIVLDPGYGFAKTAEQNLELQIRQTELLKLGFPLLVGWSRKSTLGVVTGRDTPDRLSASLAAALVAVSRGARIVRVHDVAPTVDALKVWRAMGGAGFEIGENRS